MNNRGSLGLNKYLDSTCTAFCLHFMFLIMKIHCYKKSSSMKIPHLMNTMILLMENQALTYASEIKGPQ